MNRVCTFLLNLQNINCGSTWWWASGSEVARVEARPQISLKIRWQCGANSLCFEISRICIPNWKPWFGTLYLSKILGGLNLSHSRKRDLFYVAGLPSIAIYCHLLLNPRISPVVARACEPEAQTLREFKQDWKAIFTRNVLRTQDDEDSWCGLNYCWKLTNYRNKNLKYHKTCRVYFLEDNYLKPKRTYHLSQRKSP